MERVTLGKTGITVNKNGFGALPIQRISTEDAVKLARKAYDAGITFFDTALSARPRSAAHSRTVPQMRTPQPNC